MSFKAQPPMRFPRTRSPGAGTLAKISPIRAAQLLTAVLLACATPIGAQAFSGGAASVLIPKPGLTGDELSRLPARERDAILARTVAATSFDRAHGCRPGVGRFLARRPDGTAFWRMDCADGSAHLVVMPTEVHGAAAVRSCRRGAELEGVGCQPGQARRAAR